jgi:hypothetical protein
MDGGRFDARAEVLNPKRSRQMSSYVLEPAAQQVVEALSKMPPASTTSRAYRPH